MTNGSAARKIEIVGAEKLPAQVIDLAAERARRTGENPEVAPSPADLPKEMQARYESLAAESKGFMARLWERAARPIDRAKKYVASKEKVAGRATKRVNALIAQAEGLDKQIRGQAEALAREAMAADQAVSDLAEALGEDAAQKIIAKQEKELAKKNAALEAKQEKLQKEQEKIRARLEKENKKRLDYESRRDNAVTQLDERIYKRIRETGTAADTARESLQGVQEEIATHDTLLGDLRDRLRDLEEARKDVKDTVAESAYDQGVAELEDAIAKVREDRDKLVGTQTKLEQTITERERTNTALVADLGDHAIYLLLKNPEHEAWLIDKLPHDRIETMIAAGVLDRKDMEARGLLRGTKETPAQQKEAPPEELRREETETISAEELATSINHKLPGTGITLELPAELREDDWTPEDAVDVAYDAMKTLPNVDESKRESILAKLMKFLSAFVSGTRAAEVMGGLREKKRTRLSNAVEHLNRRRKDKIEVPAAESGRELSRPALKKRLVELARHGKNPDANADTRVLDLNEVGEIDRAVKEMTKGAH